MRPPSLLLFTLFSIAVCGTTRAAANTPDRKIDLLFGVPKSKHVLYSGSTFECVDKSKRIPISAVNDDYCDCLDGSDEPGSSACNNGQFYCANEGFKGAYISSTRVNDGICDPECCDGSDELLGGLVTCPNKCKEQGEIHRRKLAEEKKIWKKAQAEKKRVMEQSKKATTEREKEIDKLAAEVESLQKVVDRLRYVQTKGEAWEEKKKQMNPAIDVLTELSGKMQNDFNDKMVGCNTRVSDLRRSLEETYDLLDVLEDIAGLLKSIPDDSPLRADANLILVFEKIAWYNNVKDTHNMSRQSITDTLESDKEAEKLLIENVQVTQETLVEMSSRVTEQVRNAFKARGRAKTQDDVCKDPHTTMYLCASMTAERTWKALREAVEATILWPGWGKLVVRSTKAFDSIIARPRSSSEEKTSSASYEPAADGDEDEAAKILADLTPEEVANAKYNLQVVRDQLSENDRKVSEANDKLDQLKKKRGVDYGPDGIWESLSGKCFSVDTAEYKYEACLFEKATQMQKGSTYGPSLGQFSRWGPRTNLNPNAPKYHYMMFEGGERCWNGPERSVEIAFECGPENVVVSVSEPSKCEYGLKFRTPLVCPDSFDDGATEGTPRDEL
ncbi:glucosidase II beta subunit-like-domain-containing protein [Cladochytrium replicatum]|nr:glucosidase II beta subunit-like-domain-containing protein [Cladochytrium replicatum]